MYLHMSWGWFMGPRISPTVSVVNLRRKEKEKEQTGGPAYKLWSSIGWWILVFRIVIFQNKNQLGWVKNFKQDLGSKICIQVDAPFQGYGSFDQAERGQVDNPWSFCASQRKKLLFPPSECINDLLLSIASFFSWCVLFLGFCSAWSVP